MSSTYPTGSLLLPLQHTRFRQLWLANFFSSLGNWMQAFAVSWGIASASKSALAVALVQAMTWAPVMLFSLPAGVLADTSCRPTLLFRSNALMACGACAMVVSTMFAPTAVAPMLVLTFVMATGTAFIAPAWQASMSGLVLPDEVEGAATLNNLSYNAAALLGPALGSACFAYVGATGLFVFNAFSFCALLWLYKNWSGHTSRTAPRQCFSVGDTVRMAWRSRPFRRLLTYTAGIFIASSALLVFLPLFASGAGNYGVMMGTLGAGALCAGISLPALRRRIPRRMLLAGALAIHASMLAVLGASHAWALHLTALFCGGMAWAAIVTTLNGSAQTAFPDAVRASTLAVYIVVVAGGQTFGSAAWGLLAERIGSTAACLAAAVLMLLCAARILLTDSFLEPQWKRTSEI